jgi:hypothetical protein
MENTDATEILFEIMEIIPVFLTGSENLIMPLRYRR